MTRHEPQPDPNMNCNDPTHDDHCTCGARPDHEYEQRMEENR